MNYQILGIVIKLRTISTAYSLKLVIDKGLVDVLKPRWITDSLEAGLRSPHDLEVRPFALPQHNHVYAAESGLESHPARFTTKDEYEDMAEGVKQEEDDPELAEWFKVDEGQV